MKNNILLEFDSKDNFRKKYIILENLVTNPSKTKLTKSIKYLLNNPYAFSSFQ